MTVTKRHLMKEVSGKAGIKQQTIASAVNTLFNVMRKSLEENNRIEIRGFGVFEVRRTKARPDARNPRTGETVYVPPRRKVYFKPSKLIKKELSQPIE